MKKKVLSMLLCLTMAAGMLTGCGSENESSQAGNSLDVQESTSEQSSNEESEETGSSDAATEDGEAPAGEPTVIRWGHNWISEMDTTYRDPVTGESSLSPEDMEARLYAEQQVLEKYNCKIEFVQYPSDLTEIILQSVLAGDPIADVVRLTNGSQGQVLAQNVLQPLDDYAYLFEDEDDAWIYWGKVYGHNYFLNNVMRFGSNDFLCYNIGILDEVDRDCGIGAGSCRTWGLRRRWGRYFGDRTGHFTGIRCGFRRKSGRSFRTTGGFRECRGSV